MKQFIKARLVPSVLCVTLLASLSLFSGGAAATQVTSLRNPRPEPTVTQDPSELELSNVKSLKTTNFRPEVLSAKFAQLNRSDPRIRALSAHLQQKGFKPQTGAKHFFGFEHIDQHPDGRTAKLSVLVQDYSRPGSKELGAVAMITISSGGQADTYAFNVVSTGDDFKQVEEHLVDKNLNVVLAHSFWTCFVNSFTSRCSSNCASALVTCPTGSWAAYLGCLAVRCGLCAVRAFGCCLCDCSWWCRWAVGCCHR
jgi:hypothetical protein